jgi:hypothetical protein
MDEQHSNFGYMCPECRRIFLRRDSKHKNCTIGELGGKNLKFVSRNNYQFGEEKKEQYNKFKKESRKLVITIENISNNTQPIIPSKLTLTEEKEQKDKKKRDKKDKENKNSVSLEGKRKHSPARSRSITPVPESRILVITPQNSTGTFSSVANEEIQMSSSLTLLALVL